MVICLAMARFIAASLVLLLLTGLWGCQSQSPFGKDKPPESDSGWEVGQDKDFMEGDLQELDEEGTNVPE